MEELRLYLIVLQKAFDCVGWIKFPEMRQDIGVNVKERRLICNFHVGQIMKLSLNQWEPDSMQIEKGVRKEFFKVNYF